MATKKTMLNILQECYTMTDRIGGKFAHFVQQQKNRTPSAVTTLSR